MPVNIKRMEQSVRVLQEVIAQKRGFNLDHWAGHEKIDDPKDEFCGTTACACGWFALDSEMSAEGLKLRVDYYVGIDTDSESAIVGSIAELNDIVHDADVEFDEATIVFGDFESLSAAMSFFGLSDHEAKWLFHARNYPSNARGPQAVIDRMKAIINREKIIQGISSEAQS